MNPNQPADFYHLLNHLDVACRKAADMRVDILSPNAARNLAVAVALGHVPHFSRRDGDGDGHDPQFPSRIFEYALSGNAFRWQIAHVRMTSKKSKTLAQSRLEDRISRAHEFIFAGFRPPEPGTSPLQITCLFRAKSEAVKEELRRQIDEVKPTTTLFNFCITLNQLRRMVQAGAAGEEESFRH
jgi:hypothetical protein